jgi:hypothetical protein
MFVFAACPPGYGGAPGCGLQCAPGSFQDGTWGSCQPCAPGDIAPQPGAAACSEPAESGGGGGAKDSKDLTNTAAVRRVKHCKFRVHVKVHTTCRAEPFWQRHCHCADAIASWTPPISCTDSLLGVLPLPVFLCASAACDPGFGTAVGASSICSVNCRALDPPQYQDGMQQACQQCPAGKEPNLMGTGCVERGTSIP